MDGQGGAAGGAVESKVQEPFFPVKLPHRGVQEELERRMDKTGRRVEDVVRIHEKQPRTWNRAAKKFTYVFSWSC